MSNLPARSSLRNDLFSPVEQAFDQFFNDFFHKSSLSRVRAYAGYPKLDVVEDNGEILLHAAVPGVKPEDLKVEMIDDGAAGESVQISGSIDETYCHTEPSNSNYNFIELSKRRFSRKVNLGQKLGEPTAKLKNGMLTLSWKAQKRSEPERNLVRIEVE